MASVQELKEKFNAVQGISQSLKEEKIGLESELKTLQSEYDSKLAELLSLTGADSFEAAVSVYNVDKEKLSKDMDELNSELTRYLDTYGEESDN